MKRNLAVTTNISSALQLQQQLQRVVPCSFVPCDVVCVPEKCARAVRKSPEKEACATGKELDWGIAHFFGNAV